MNQGIQTYKNNFYSVHKYSNVSVFLSGILVYWLLQTYLLTLVPRNTLIKKRKEKVKCDIRRRSWRKYLMLCICDITKHVSTILENKTIYTQAISLCTQGLYIYQGEEKNLFFLLLHSILSTRHFFKPNFLPFGLKLKETLYTEPHCRSEDL